MQHCHNSHRIMRIMFCAGFLLLLASVLFACAPQLSSGNVSEDTKKDVQKNAETSTNQEKNATTTQAFTFTSESKCENCHTVETTSSSDSSCLAAKHAMQSPTDCATCHADESGLKEAHASVTIGDKAPRSLKKTRVSDETCMGCHPSYEELAVATANSTVFTDANGMVVNPHLATNTNPDHQEAFSCGDCHGMHKASDPQKFCTTCHHTGTYECGSCHEKK